jgi:hypothetical protein
LTAAARWGRLLAEAGFVSFRFCQTIFHEAAVVTSQEPVREGHGQGLFAVIRAKKP